MAEPTTEWTIGFGRLGARIRRRWRTLVAVLVVVLAAAAAAGLLAPHQYTATASVAVAPIRLTTYSSNSDINISTERAVIGSRQVATLAANSLTPAVSPESLTEATTVAAPSGSTVLQVSVTAPSADAAAARANAIASAYLAFRAQTALASAQASIDSLQSRIASTNPKSVSTLADLRAQLTALQHVGDGTARIIGRAGTPGSPSSVGLSTYLVGGLVGGLLLGLLAAAARDVTDRRVRFAARLSDAVRRAAVVVHGDDDVEAARWIVRAVDGSRRTGSAARGSVVAVLSVGAVPVSALLESMRAFGRLASIDVAVVSRTALDAGDLERGWTYRPEPGRTPDLVLVDASGIGSVAQRVMLADAADSVLVVAGPGSRLADVVDLRDLLEDAGPGPLVPVFLTEDAIRASGGRDRHHAQGTASARELATART